MGEVVKFANTPVAIRRRLNELQRVLNDRNVTIDSLLNQVHEESMAGAASQQLYDDLLAEYIKASGVDNISLGDLEYSSNLGVGIDSAGNITVKEQPDYDFDKGFDEDE
jgi:hypothetical protein